MQAQDRDKRIQILRAEKGRLEKFLCQLSEDYKSGRISKTKYEEDVRVPNDRLDCVIVELEDIQGSCRPAHVVRHVESNHRGNRPMLIAEIFKEGLISYEQR